MPTNKLFRQAHRHNYYMVFLPTAGVGRQLIDFQSYPIQKGRVFLLYPGMIHAWEEEEDLEGYLIFFTADFFTLRYNTNSLLAFPFFGSSYGLPFVDFAEGEDWQRLNQLLEFMLVEHARGDEESVSSLRSYLNIVLQECRRAYQVAEKEPEKDQHQQRLIKTFEQLIDRDYAKERQVRAYAAMLRLTPSYLNTVCKSVTGRSAGDLIRQRVMLEARRMLLHDDRTVSEVGHALNFADNAYFCRFFKKYEGVSPDKFRRQIWALK